MQGRTYDGGSQPQFSSYCFCYLFFFTLLTVLPCSYTASPSTGHSPPWTSPAHMGVFHSSPSTELTQWWTSSKPWPLSGSITSCITVISTGLCSFADPSTTLHRPTFPPPIISEDCRVSACHLTMGQSEMAVLACVPSFFLLCWVTAWLVIAWLLLLLPYPLLNKRVLPKEKMLPNHFSLLNRFVWRSFDWRSLGQRRGQIHIKNACLKKLLTEAMIADPYPSTKTAKEKSRSLLLHYQNYAKY